MAHKDSMPSSHHESARPATVSVRRDTPAATPLAPTSILLHPSSHTQPDLSALPLPRDQKASHFPTSTAPDGHMHTSDSASIPHHLSTSLTPDSSSVSNLYHLLHNLLHQLSPVLISTSSAPAATSVKISLLWFLPPTLPLPRLLFRLKFRPLSMGFLPRPYPCRRRLFRPGGNHHPPDYRQQSTFGNRLPPRRAFYPPLGSGQPNL